MGWFTKLNLYREGRNRVWPISSSFIVSKFPGWKRGYTDMYIYIHTYIHVHIFIFTVVLCIGTTHIYMYTLVAIGGGIKLCYSILVPLFTFLYWDFFFLSLRAFMESLWMIKFIKIYNVNDMSKTIYMIDFSIFIYCFSLSFFW